MTWTLERIYAKCEVDEETGCRLWSGGMTNEGKYPITQVPDPSKPHGQRQVHVRRLVWQLAKRRQAPSGPRWVMVPSCGNQRCVDEDCLQVMSKAQRLRQAAEANPYHRTVAFRAKIAAGKASRCKVTDDQVAALLASTEPVAVLAGRYGLSKGYTYALKAGQARRDYSSPFAALLPIPDRQRR